MPTHYKDNPSLYVSPVVLLDVFLLKKSTKEIMAANQNMETQRVLGELIVYHDASKDYFDVEKQFLVSHHNSLGLNWNIYTPEGKAFKFLFHEGFVTLTGRVVGGWKDFYQEETINNGDKVVFQYLGFSKFNYIREAAPANVQ
ncbi:hypothetical protein RIF29_19382 [Crotalaria pallida]|uniref:TF-B3 domain-containing protein n=1 Tax=Crotalaria pallida TaxID=3830 RepID=A0AAN9F1V6_CROPI